MQYERTEVAGFGEKRDNSLANSAKSGILSDTEQSGIPITEEAIQRVPLVRPEGWTEEQAAKLQEAHRELLRSVMDKPIGTEAGAIYSPDLKLLERRTGDDAMQQISIRVFVFFEFGIMSIKKRANFFGKTEKIRRIPS